MSPHPHLVTTGREFKEMLVEGQRSQGLPGVRQGPRDMRQMASEMPEADSSLWSKAGTRAGAGPAATVWCCPQLRAGRGLAWLFPRISLQYNPVTRGDLSLSLLLILDRAHRRLSTRNPGDRVVPALRPMLYQKPKGPLAAGRPG